MLLIGIKYSIRDLICDIYYCAWPTELRYR